MKNILLILLACMGLVGGSLQGQGILKGTVTDVGSNEPLAGATLMLTDKSAGALTDDDGKFELSVKQNPPFRVMVTYVGFDTLELEITGFDKSLKLALQPRGVDLDVVEIVGMNISEKQKEAPLTVESMGSIAIKEVAGSDFYASLGNMKGVDLTSASLGFKIINTRGFNSTSPVRSLQIIDGVDNQAPGLNFSLGNFLGASELDLQKVDLIVGAASAFYGPNAFNGVISMTTKSPFVHQGLSLQARVGERNLAELALRYAHAFKNKSGEDFMAFKINAYAMRADDFEATNNDPTPQSLVGENNWGSYDAVNRYGDENLTANSNNALSNSGRIQSPGLGVYHRTGYWERDVVDYDTRNLKLSAAIHFKVLKGAELIASSNFGTGTTVYQGDNRYSLKDILFFQHRVELKKEGKYFLRAYYTHEDAGKSYDAVYTAFLMQRAAKNDAQWSTEYRNHWQTRIVPKVQSLPGFPVFQFPNPYDYAGADSIMNIYSDSLQIWHDQTRAVADAANPVFGSLDRFEPGTAAFDSVLADITSKSAFGQGGTRFFDRSALAHVHGEYKFTPKFMDITVGGNFRLYRPNSDGTIFADTNGVVIRNHEFGTYLGLEKRLLDDRLKLNATARLDKNQNFNYLVSPAASAVWVVKADHILRFSFSSAIRNPTLQDQFLYYNVGRAILIGNVNGRDSLVTTESLLDFYNSQNFDTLRYIDVPAIRPEKVRTFELGYRATLGERLFLDASYYFSLYRDFIGFRIGADVTEYRQFGQVFVNQIYRIAANSPDIVSTQGISLGANYYFKKYYMLNGNYSWNKLNLRGSVDPIIPAFNTPEHKFNIGFGGRNIPIKLGDKQWNDFGFNANFKWVQGFEFAGSPQFTGQVPTYYLVDAQVNKYVKKLHATFKIGGSNLLNRQQLQVFGGPYVGRLMYFQLLLELDKL
jgi:outer membrane receptor protein involved in Fe transport